MTLSLRTLTNAGDPLCTPDGQVLSGVRVSFQLVDRYGVETDVWDALTHERVGGEPIVATTNEDGEFSIDLWPNSRGNRPTHYRCTVDHPAFKAFSGTVDHLSLDPLQWVEFMAASATIAPQDLGEMSLYRQELAAGLQTLGTAVGVAGASATASQGSATAAGASASQAASQAAAASASATAAAGSATTASTQAGVASTQAGQAATSATLAQQWATRTDAEVVAGQGYGAMKYALDAAGSASAASAAAATVSGLQTALDGKVDASDPRLSDAREWTAATVTQPEAEAGTDTTRRAWTAQRVRQAMLGWWGGFAAKATPVDADSIVIADSAASDAPKRLSWANAVAKLRGTFVEGPASSVDGQVMLFDGATGKRAKSGGALPDTATPEQFGAVGDGVTDDSDALISALAGAKTVTMRSGAVYLVSKPLKMSPGQLLNGNVATLKRANQVTTTMVGDLAHDSTDVITVAAGDGAKFKVGQRIMAYKGTSNWSDCPKITSIVGDVITTDVQYRFYNGTGTMTSPVSICTQYDLLNTAEDSTVRDLKIDGNNSNWTRARWETCTDIGISGHNSTLDNVIIRNSPGEAIMQHGAFAPDELRNTRILGVRVYNAKGNGIHLSGCIGTLIDGFYVDGSNLDADIGHQDGCVAFSNGVKHVQIRNFHLNNGKNGVGGMRALDSSRVIIQGGVITNAREQAISSVTSGTGSFIDVLIDSVKIYDSIKLYVGKENDTNGVFPSNWVISNCMLYNTRIEVQHVDNISITGCLIDLTGDAVNACVAFFMGGRNNSLTDCILLNGKHGVIIGGDAFVTIENCTLDGQTDTGVNPYDSTANVVVSDSTIRAGTNAIAGYIGVKCQSKTIVKNTAFEVDHGTSIHFSGNNAIAFGNVIRMASGTSIKAYGGSSGMMAINNFVTVPVSNGGGASNTFVDNRTII